MASNTLQQYVGRLTLSSEMDDFGVGENTLQLNTGQYYMIGYSGENNGLCWAVENAIREIDNQSNAVCNWDQAARRIGIYLNTAANITFDDTNLATAMGYDNPALSSARSHVATYQPRFMWLPSETISDYPGDLTAWWSPRSTTQGARSKDGTTYTAKGNLMNDGTYGYVLLPKEDVINSSDSNWFEAFDQFWQDVIHAGQPMRVYPDASLESSTDYVTAIVAVDDGGVGSFEDYRARHVESYNGLWGVELELWEHVEAE